VRRVVFSGRAIAVVLAFASCKEEQPTPSLPSEGSVYEQGCNDAGVAECQKLGELYAKGEGGLPKNLNLAIGLFSHACSEGVAAGCASLGDAYEQGFGVPVDIRQAAAHYKRGCVIAGEDFDADACYALGTLHQLGKGVDKDLPKAAELYNRACSRGSARGCHGLAYLHFVGKGVEKNPARAAELFTKACKGGDAWACDNLKRLRAQQGLKSPW
jgi:TPR repeat protein